MASVRPTSAGKFELTIRNKLLPKPVYLTFDSEAEAKTYGEQCDSMLRAGVVPKGLVADEVKPATRLSIVLQAHLNSGDVAPSEEYLVTKLRDELGGLRITELTYTWAQGWVQGMKLGKTTNYTPGTIRKRIGALTRALDTYARNHPDLQLVNPLHLLPRGAATYNTREREAAEKLGLEAKVDLERDRRLKPGELERIIAALGGHKRPDRERALDLPHADAVRMLFLMVLYTGTRLRETYTLGVDQVDMRGRVLRVKAGKQHYGRVAWREVPMRRELHAALTHYLGLREYAPGARLFPWWDGQASTLDTITNRLSQQFGRLFAYAECPGLTEHDLRHEATCQWYELRDAAGGWMFREQEIHRIMGWKPGSKMPTRYASFRAESLAERLWVGG